MKSTQTESKVTTPVTVEQTPLDAAIEATSRTKSITERTAHFLGVPLDKVFDALRGIWTTSKSEPPLTNAEMMVGMALVARYDLDPFAREIYVTRNKGKIMIVLGVDGWIRVLDRTDHYDGFRQSIDRDEGGRVVSVTTTIYSTKRTVPTEYVALASEYAKVGGFVSNVMPVHMLRIFSLRHACRLFTPVSGAMTQEEASYMAADPEAGSQPQTLDDLADKLAAPPLPKIPSPPPPPLPPATSPDDAIDRAQILDEFASEFARLGKVRSEARILAMWDKVLLCHVAGTINDADLAALAELANAAKVAAAG